MLLTEVGRRRAADGPGTDDVVRFDGHPPHRHDRSQLVHLVLGRATLDIAGERVELAEGQGVWVPAGVEHALTLEAGGVVLGPLLSPGLDPPSGAPRRVADPGVRRVLVTLLSVAPRDGDEVQVFRRALEIALVAATGEQFSLRLPTHPAARAIAADVVRSRGTLAQLADREFLSARQVQRLFLDQTGLSFATWRTRARLNAAIARLRAGRGVPAALDASGFTTREGLVKALARECGLPAGEVLAYVVAPAVTGT
ncbi:AraC family transcriptional regulator [Modestobacter sp. Leaf380]|uniref:AraC family transcriptional regulator n=1 Tax=Modestobacter sp. Leaf380 TaxID=1736356 RepID=UPI0009EA365F|nr:AraC family transcriptional regulator [Modestobacter sp. Leaf380]